MSLLCIVSSISALEFWSSDILTGSQTMISIFTASIPYTWHPTVHVRPSRWYNRPRDAVTRVSGISCPSVNQAGTALSEPQYRDRDHQRDERRRMDNLNRFWSSDILTGSQTRLRLVETGGEFWSSDILTGSQTAPRAPHHAPPFWSSDILTGSQTALRFRIVGGRFWSSDILTGSQTESGDVER